MFKPNRKIVVIRSIDGKIENSSGSFMYMVIRRITSDKAILTTNSISSSHVGSGMIIRKIARITNTVTMLFIIFFTVYT